MMAGATNSGKIPHPRGKIWSNTGWFSQEISRGFVPCEGFCSVPGRTDFLSHGRVLLLAYIIVQIQHLKTVSACWLISVFA